MMYIYILRRLDKPCLPSLDVRGRGGGGGGRGGGGGGGGGGGNVINMLPASTTAAQSDDYDDDDDDNEENDDNDDDNDNDDEDDDGDDDDDDDESDGGDESDEDEDEFDMNSAAAAAAAAGGVETKLTIDHRKERSYQTPQHVAGPPPPLQQPSGLHRFGASPFLPFQKCNLESFQQMSRIPSSSPSSGTVVPQLVTAKSSAVTSAIAAGGVKSLPKAAPKLTLQSAPIAAAAGMRMPTTSFRPGFTKEFGGSGLQLPPPPTLPSMTASGSEGSHYLGGSYYRPKTLSSGRQVADEKEGGQ